MFKHLQAIAVTASSKGNRYARSDAFSSLYGIAPIEAFNCPASIVPIAV
tara:strand:- start:4190 stop:4336 length:147 start_codon:yes stop_codon:yes gene_type:complete